MDKVKLMPFWDHVYELRNRLLLVVGAITVFSVCGYMVFPFFVEWLFPIIGENLYITNITEGFVIRMEVGVLFGLLVSLPLFLSQLTFFLAPALKVRQKVFLSVSLVLVLGLFILGVVFALDTVMPLSIAFLKSDVFFPENVNRLISFSSFIRFFFQFLLGFGLFFEFPVLLLVLMKFHLATPKSLARNSKYFIPLIFLVAAILTPPDVVSQVLLATPMVALFYLSILVGAVLRLGA